MTDSECPSSPADEVESDVFQSLLLGVLLSAPVVPVVVYVMNRWVWHG